MKLLPLGKGLGIRAALLTGSLSCLALSAQANDATVNLYGSAGVIDTPNARMLPDGTLTTTYSNFAGTGRSTLSFQITPRLSGSFRYSIVDGLVVPQFNSPKYYDRSFDIRYQILTETGRRPAVVIGMQDFIGTGLYGAEYVVATKEVLPGLRVSGGIGWGRLGSYKPIGSTGTRPNIWHGTGGVPTYDHWFKGDFAPFGGIEWNVSERVTLKAEYGSDNYWREQRDGLFSRKSPMNFGVDYRFDSGAQLSIFSLYGDTVGALLSLQFDPRRPFVPGGNESAPLPVSARAAAARSDLGWVGNSLQTEHSRTSMNTLLAREGLIVEALTLEPTRAILRLKNQRYLETPQAIGRTARAMTRTLPASVETLVIVPVVDGMEVSAITLKRSDVEQLENADAMAIYERAGIQEGLNIAPDPVAGQYPRFNWSLSPYYAFSVFDPSQPFRADVGARLRLGYSITPGIEVSGSIIKRLGGNLSGANRPTTSGLPAVRTRTGLYLRDGDPAVERLTLSAYGRPAENLYSRITAGYLERMYAGVSAEILYKPVNSRLAFGAELNFVKPRAFDGGFDLLGYNTASGMIPKFNGHVSAYYDFENGFHGQLDVGRYLAGDYGATITVDREFRNGWKVGAYATFTDASAQSFGEGSFDKGIRVTIPLSWASGKPSQSTSTVVLQSLTRDGGAKLDVDGRLYERVRGYHRPVMSETWGRFWR